VSGRSTLLIDLTIALVAMIVLVIVSPGLAIVGLVALLVLAGCGLSFLVQTRRRRRRARVGPPPRRTPPRRPARRY
jgi:ABC-type bacteriocin/lantibiotic exporter with double-glycine peptidase domain